MQRFWLLLITICMCVLSACPSLPADKPAYWKKALGKASSHTEKAIILGNLRKQKPLDAEFLPLLHEVLAEEKSPDVRVAAVRIIADLRHPSSLGPLQNALNLKAGGAHARDLNRAIAEALVALKAPETEPVFLEMLKNKDSFTLFPAVEGLGQLRSKQAVPFFVEMLENSATPMSEQIRYIAALGQIADPSAIPVLEKKLYTSPLEQETALALFRIGAPAAEALLRILQEKNPALRQWASNHKIPPELLVAHAASVLGDMQELRAESTLIARLAAAPRRSDASRLLRAQSVNALGRMRSTKATSTLSRLVLEQDTELRGLCVLALAQIGDKSAIAALQKATLASGDFDERLRSMMGIALLGGEAELAFFNKQIDNERVHFGKDQVRFREECGSNACDEQIKRLGEKRMEALNQLKDILETGSKCEEKEACWAEVLADVNANSFKRQRAAFFLGRSKNPEHVASLGKQLADADLDVRMSVLLGLAWLAHDVPAAASRAKALIPSMQQQIDDERGRTQYAGTRDEMLRVLWVLQHSP